jgi:hypothetical protein
MDAIRFIIQGQGVFNIHQLLKGPVGMFPGILKKHFLVILSPKAQGLLKLTVLNKFILYHFNTYFSSLQCKT